MFRKCHNRNQLKCMENGQQPAPCAPQNRYSGVLSLWLDLLVWNAVSVGVKHILVAKIGHPWINMLLLDCDKKNSQNGNRGARWLSGRVSDSGARGRGFETYRRHVVSLSKTLYSPKVLVNYPGSGGSVPTWLKNCWLGRLASTQPTNKMEMAKYGTF